MPATPPVWRFTLTLTLVVALSAAAVGGFSQELAPAPESPTFAGGWPMEQVELTDGTTYQGLILAETPTTLEFLEVHRPPGKPMGLIVRPLNRQSVKGWQRISAQQREALATRLERYKRRTLIEGRRMEDLSLTPSKEDGQELWNYQGNWLTLQSTADELMTRRLIVRLGQIFTAYRQLVPPRSRGGRPSAHPHLRQYGAISVGTERVGAGDSQSGGVSGGSQSDPGRQRVESLRRRAGPGQRAASRDSRPVEHPAGR